MLYTSKEKRDKSDDLDVINEKMNLDRFVTEENDQNDEKYYDIPVSKMCIDYPQVRYSHRKFKPADFIIFDPIGRGASGGVFRAIEKLNEKEVVLKIIPIKSIVTERHYRQLQREIEIHSHLKHPHIAQMYAYFKDENNIFIVMEYCPNGNLAERIKEGKMSEKKIASIIKALLQAVEYMRKRKVMHRDIKLENILFDQNYEAKLADFGWCCHVDKPRKTFCGTMEYICPEMIKEESYFFEVDIYCIGIVLYELLMHRSPFKGETEEETMLNIKYKTIEFDETNMKEYEKEVSEAAKNIIQLMLERDGSKRPPPEILLKHSFFEKYETEKQIRLSELEYS